MMEYALYLLVFAVGGIIGYGFGKSDNKDFDANGGAIPVPYKIPERRTGITETKAKNGFKTGDFVTPIDENGLKLYSGKIIAIYDDGALVHTQYRRKSDDSLRDWSQFYPFDRLQHFHGEIS